jgi:hypothetical protein
MSLLPGQPEYTDNSFQMPQWGQGRGQGNPTPNQNAYQNANPNAAFQNGPNPYLPPMRPQPMNQYRQDVMAGRNINRGEMDGLGGLNSRPGSLAPIWGGPYLPTPTIPPINDFPMPTIPSPRPPMRRKPGARSGIPRGTGAPWERGSRGWLDGRPFTREDWLNQRKQRAQMNKYNRARQRMPRTPLYGHDYMNTPEGQSLLQRLASRTF